MYEPSDELYTDWFESTSGGCERCGHAGSVAHHGEWLCERCADIEDEFEQALQQAGIPLLHHPKKAVA